ncbi:MAG: hypothetical protein HQL84_13150 [Magnetococcales bacterium]|nr:hypothetical protein [Magnetococcales bacterium]MBF0150980.1 hypothetical protein [Magnetococcales bacterium]
MKTMNIFDRVGRFLAGIRQLRSWWPFMGALLVLLAACWASTGTLAPYATTHPTPLELRCGYLANIDHPVHFQPFLLFKGAPPELWQSSILLRRILYPVLAWPLVAQLGYDMGGLLTNILLTLAGILVWLLFIHRQVGRTGAITSAWLLATYPGITYWVGLPYSYAVIVPAMLIACVLLWKIAQESAPISHIVLFCSGIGILLTSYDGLMPILVPAVLWILWRRRWVRRIPVAMVGLIWPMGLNLVFLHGVLGVNLYNSNSQTYRIILGSWLHASFSWQNGWDQLLELPTLAAHLFFFSNFFFLPLAFLFFVVLMKKYDGMGLNLVEEGILVASVVFFLFLNLAPDYPGWQMRGTWIARIYQPVFVVFVFYLSRGLGQTLAIQSGRRRWAIAMVGVTVIANGWIVFGGLHASRISDWAYRNFYQHGEPFRYSYNLEKYGIRPLGFCRQPSASP